MADFRKMIVTTKGRNLIAKLISGSSGTRFSRVAFSSTAYTDAQIPVLTSISGIKQTAAVIHTTKLSDAAVRLDAAVRNDTLTAGYTLQSIAVYAIDPDEGEILYSVAGASTPGYVPQYNGVTVTGTYLSVITTVSNADRVDVTVDPAAVATLGDILVVQQLIEEARAESDVAVRILTQYTLQRDRTVDATLSALDAELRPEVGTVLLVNSERYPFNNSAQTVSLEKTRSSTNYTVEVLLEEYTNGLPGEIHVFDKAVNGFKIAFDGSSGSVSVKYIVKGGFMA